MLVIDGKLHPRFLPDSSSRYIRNGVGTTASGDRAVFVISRNAVTLHDFASFFRDALELPQALYLDGNVSRLYAPELGRADWGPPDGPHRGRGRVRGIGLRPIAFGESIFGPVKEQAVPARRPPFAFLRFRPLDC